MPTEATARIQAAGRIALCLVLLACAAALGPASPATATRANGGGGADASIVHGQAAAPGKFPWMAFIVDVQGDGATLCTGTVVSPWVVLTAAHCVYGEDGSLSPAENFLVITGVTDWTRPERQVSEVTRVIPFPKFATSGDGFGDTALLVLGVPTTVPRITLARKQNARLYRTGARALIAGWGQTYFGQKAPTRILYWTRLRLEGGKRCEGLHGRICAIDFPKARSGACHGDSGGPLLARGRRGRGYLQIGIVQGGFGECSTRRPSLYMRADVVARWVNTRIRKVESSVAAAPPAPAPTTETAPTTP